MKTKRLLIMMLLVMVLGSGTVFAQGRFDIGIKAPLFFGIDGLTDTDGEPIPMSGDVGAFIPIPSAFLGGQLDLAIIKLGVGLQLYSAIIQTVMYPAVYGEVDLGFLVANLTVGGGVFASFGMLGANVSTAELLIPDLSAHLRLGKIFQIGLGVLGFTGFESTESDIFPYIGYFSAKVSLTF
jgi:hypothetical protein